MSKQAMTRSAEPASDSLYETDFRAWTRRTAELLRARRFEDIDVEHAAEEIEDMGKRDAKELSSRMRVLIGHLLKWQMQPSKRSRSWAAAIVTQRHEIEELLELSPSLRHQMSNRLAVTYGRAVRETAAETGLPARRFPRTCPYTLAQLVDVKFLPE